jgi:hypothetical protein
MISIHQRRLGGQAHPLRSIGGRFSAGLIVILMVAFVLCSSPIGLADDPLVKAKFGLFVQEGNTLGLPSANAKSSMVYFAATGGNHYSHHPFIINFHDQLYVMWSSGQADEDSPSQRVDYAVSSDGVHWSPARIFAVDPDGPGGPKRRTAGGWWIAQGTLYACFATHSGPSNNTGNSAQKWAGDVTLEYSSSSDGITWTPSQPMITHFMPNEGPRWNGKYWITTGENAFGVTKILYTDDPLGVGSWRESRLPPVLSEKEPNESSWYRRPDGTLIMVFRDDNHGWRLFDSKSTDDGVSWSQPQRAGFADATSKVRAGNLPDGEAYIINNPATNGARIPLAISISRDGRLFDRSYAVRWENTNFRYPGVNKGAGYSYPNSMLWGDSLYVVYSVNKEDIAVSQIPLTRLETP